MPGRRMIHFRCHCSQEIEVPSDQAGGYIQCPNCGRLNDVPLLSDLPNLTEDGTYKIEEPVPDDPDRLHDAARVYTPSRVDEFGQEIDLRRKVGGDDPSGPIDLAYESRQPERISPPRYDPITGELIRPVEVKPPSPPTIHNALPAARKTKKRRGIEPLARVQTFELFAMLLRPMNVVVMSMVALFHIFYFMSMIVAMFGILFIIVVNLICFAAIWSHYIVVIESMGPGCQDELPRPLRDVSLYEDVWLPFVALATTGFICYGPPMILLSSRLPQTASMSVAIVWAIVGTFFAPALLLTAATSGTYANLRPDRVIGVVRTLGAQYFWLLLTTICAFGTYSFGFAAIHACVLSMFAPRSMRGTPPLWLTWPGAIVLLLLGIYLMHYMGWLMGQIYRVYQPMFPWAYQGRRMDAVQIAPARGFEVLPTSSKAPQRR